MSNKTEKTRKRAYTQRARAERREAVHHRIVLATVELHGSVGPARTTMGEIAKRAGVRRATVYNHFATDLELIDACSSHWFSENRPPNPADWAEIDEADRRIRVALEEMYGYYSNGREMLDNVFRDAPLVPALGEILRQKWWPMIDGIVEILAARSDNSVDTRPSDSGGRDLPERQNNITQDQQSLRATLKVVLNFFTWLSLAESGLSNQQAAALAGSWIEAGRTTNHKS